MCAGDSAAGRVRIECAGDSVAERCRGGSVQSEKSDSVRESESVQQKIKGQQRCGADKQIRFVRQTAGASNGGSAERRKRQTTVASNGGSIELYTKTANVLSAQKQSDTVNRVADPKPRHRHKSGQRL